MTGEWAVPRGFGALAAISAVAAVVYFDMYGAAAGLTLALCAAGCGWISHDMARTIRERHHIERQAARQLRRILREWS